MKYRSRLPVVAVTLYLITIVCSIAFSKAVGREAESENPTGHETSRASEESATQNALAAPQTRSIAETVQAIKAMNQEVDGCMDVGVPFTTGLLLTRLKHQLRDLIAETINTRAAQHETPAQLQSRVLSSLKQAGVELSDPPFSEIWKPEDEAIVSYGYIPEIVIEQPAHHPELLAVKTSLAINSGGDTSLYIFKRRENQWVMVLALEKNGYAEVSGAQNGFDYAISPADESGNYFIVAADVNAWPTSRWQMLRYKVLRIGASPYEPNLVFSAEHNIFRNYEPIFKLTATANRFRFDFWGLQSLDGGILDRAYILSYSVTGDRVTRIAPLASRPEDFLDEWINLSWEEAAGWVDAPNREAMQRWHQRLQYTYTGDTYYYRDFAFIQPCGEQKNTWQIGLNIDSKERADVLPAELYFTIVRAHGTFYLHDINEARQPGCPGEASPYEQ
jgi:hypothetical protein